VTSNPAIPIAPAVTVLVKLDAQGRLDEDISCRKCAYNLRSLSPDGRCPECGTAVGRSLQGDFLRFADPQWVQTLASGMNWIVAGIAIGIIVGAVAVGLIGGMGLDRRWMIFIQIAVSLIALVGYWKVTTPDPAGLEDSAKLTARKLVRICQIAGLVILLLNLLVPKGSSDWSLILVLASTPIGIISMIAVFTYAAHLALRIPDEKMARHCRIVMWGLMILMVAALLLAVAMATTGVSGALGVSGCAISLGYLFFALWALRLIERYRKAFNEAARLAAATWAAGLPPR
jgi:MFS family permease